VGGVQTPDAPRFVMWSEPERTTTYRNYLLTMKWQLRTNHHNVPELVVSIDQLLAQTTLTYDEVQPLISQVNSLTPAREPRAPQNPRRLTEDELDEFQRRMERAEELVDGLLHSPTAIADAFGTGGAIDATVRGNVKKIKGHLTRWVSEQQSLVFVNRSKNAGYVALNLDHGDDSKLMLGAHFFTETGDSTAGTLIHEASHGCLKTTDLAYMGYPYFLQLRDQLALGNADNYTYAAELAAGRQPMVHPGVHGQTTSIRMFEQALGLCYYQCSKVWAVLMYLLDEYQGTPRHLHEDTRIEHEAMMELGGDTASISILWRGDLKKIAEQRTIMLIEIMDYVRDYVAAPKTFGEVAGVISATPINNPNKPTNAPKSKVMEFNVTGANTVEAVVKRIFVKLMREAGFTEAQAKQLFRWHKALFANIRKDAEHRDKYNLSDNDLQLYNLLRT
jgi:hypothetical protein